VASSFATKTGWDAKNYFRQVMFFSSTSRNQLLNEPRSSGYELSRLQWNLTVVKRNPLYRHYRIKRTLLFSEGSQDLCLNKCRGILSNRVEMQFHFLQKIDIVAW